jgi:DnaJ-class molecular chaperone
MTDCKRCDGKGYVIDRLFAVVTVGMSLVMGWLMDNGRKNNVATEICERCDGSGKEP